MRRARTTRRTQCPSATWYDPMAGRSQSWGIQRIIRLQQSLLGSEVSMRKTAILLSFLMWTVTLAAHGQQNARFDPDGSFWVHETAPNDFSELSAINLNAKKLRRLPSPGLQITDGTTYRFKTLIVKRNDFRFTTVALKNV